MSIADRITSMSNNLSNAYDGIEYLGVDTSSIDKNLQNLSNVLDTVYNEYPKVSDEGISPSIVGSRVGRLNSTLKASDTTQESTTGKNLFNASAGVNGYIDNSGNIVDRAWQFASDYIPIQSNQEYTISVNTVSENIGTAFYDSNKQIISRADHTNISSYNFTNSSNYSYIRFWVNIGNYTPLNSTNIAETYHAQLEQGTATSYEPYTGGIPSPNPNFPQDIHVVKGNNTVFVGGKSLYDASMEETTTRGITRSADKERLYLNGTVASKGNVEFPINDTILPAGKYRLNLEIESGTVPDENGFSFYLYATTITGQTAKSPVVRLRPSPTQRGTLLDLSEPARLYIHGYNQLVDFTITNIVLKYQVTLGEAEDYDFVPYTPITTYPINLGDIELCKIGDYQDKLFKAIVGDTVYDSLTSEQKEGLVSGGWYKYEAVGKIVLDGSESWAGGSSATASTNYTYMYSNVLDGLIKVKYFKAFCDKFYVRKNTMVIGTSVDTDTIAVGDPNYQKVRIMILTSRLATQSVIGFKTWLSNNNVTVYYVLATPTITQITDSTLVSQLENLYSAMSKNGQTNILQANTDVPFTIYASALKGG